MTGSQAADGALQFQGDSYWQVLELTIASWEASETASSAADAWENIQRLVEPLSDRHRRRVLCELVVLEFERQLSVRPDVRVEEVLRRFPQLAEDSAAIQGLIREEWSARVDVQPDVLRTELARRFPQIDIDAVVPASNRESGDAADNSRTFTPDMWNSLSTRVLGRLENREFTPLPPGSRLGRYRVVKLLGRGGMGIVYLAFDEELEREVAVKVLYPWINAALASDELLLKEARIAAQIKHPSIIDVYDIGQTESGDRFVVMDYAQYVPLDRVLEDDAPLPLDQVIQIARQVAAGLAVAHERGILHRDVKPANILLDADRNARLTDFGLAVPSSQTTTSERAGTVPYMAPELVSADNVGANERTDVWSFGVVLYELFTGVRPFNGESISRVQNEIQEGDFVPVRELNPAVPKALARVCEACLERVPEKRPANGSELVRMLETASQTGLALAPASIGVALLGALLWAGWFWFGEKPVERSDVAVRELAPAVRQQICPWFLQSGCKLVYELDTGEVFDFSNFSQLELFAELKRQFELQANSSHSPTRGRIIVPGSDVVPGPDTGDQQPWVCWKVNAKFLSNRYDDRAAYFTSQSPESIQLTLLFGVAPDGRIQIGTVGNGPEQHLLILADPSQSETNYDWGPEDNFGTLLNPARPSVDPERSIPSGFHIDADRGRFYDFSVAVYRTLHRLSDVATRSEQKNGRELYECQVNLWNLFDRPIEFVSLAVGHQLLRDNWYLIQNAPERRNDVLALTRILDRQHWTALPPVSLEAYGPGDAFRNDRLMPFYARDFNRGDSTWMTWRPAIDDEMCEVAHHQIRVRFHPPQDLIGVSAYTASSDNRNSVKATLRGLTRVPVLPEYKSALPNHEEWKIDEATARFDRNNRSVDLATFNIASIEGVLFNTAFEELQIDGLQQWSTFRAGFCQAVLGELPDDYIQSATMIAVIHEAKSYPYPLFIDGLEDLEVNQHLFHRADWTVLENPVTRVYGPEPFPVNRVTIPSALTSRAKP